MKKFYRNISYYSDLRLTHGKIYEVDNVEASYGSIVNDHGNYIRVLLDSFAISCEGDYLAQLKQEKASALITIKEYSEDIKLLKSNITDLDKKIQEIEERNEVTQGSRWENIHTSFTYIVTFVRNEYQLTNLKTGHSYNNQPVPNIFDVFQGNKSCFKKIS